MKEIVKPKTDVVFKIMFTRKDNEKLLKHLYRTYSISNTTA